MPLLLTMLSVVAVWAFLTVLVLGLLLILKPLEGIRGSLEKIAMGVRAIEHEMRPLGARTGALVGSLEQTGTAMDGAVAGLAGTDRELEAAAPAFRTR